MSKEAFPVVELPRRVAIELLHLAQREPGREVCGLIGERGEELRVIPMRNVAGEAHCRFEMDERELIDQLKAMRERGETLFATYHSHPDSAPELSATDIERLGYPEALHLVISMETRGVLQMSGWRISDGRPQAVEVRIREERAARNG